MAKQIPPTPTVTGKDAEKIAEEKEHPNQDPQRLDTIKRADEAFDQLVESGNSPFNIANKILRGSGHGTRMDRSK